MLLFQKPLTDIQIGEKFRVTVTEEDWEKGLAHGLCSSSGAATNCAIAQAIMRNGGTFDAHPDPGIVGNEAGFGEGHEFTHDGEDLVRDFDMGHPFPGPRVVTFTRQS